MKIQFIGATSEVTGSMTLVQFQQGKVLIDSGLHQGLTETVEKNYSELPFNSKEIKAVFLTHAHLDHCGYLPKLVKEGFRGQIFCTRPTMKLARIILTDSAKLQEQNQDHFPLYEQEEVTKTLSLFKPIEFDQWFSFLDVNFCFHPAGHILGASSIEIREEKTVVFSGDLGRSDDPYMAAPVPCPSADMIVMESTYGGKNREGNIEKELHTFLVKIARENRVGIIATFAVARAQMLLNLIDDFYHRHPEEKIRVVIDGPMMTEANKVYKEFAGKTYGSLSEFEVIEHAMEWESLKKKSGPLLVLSSSGMLTGGRIWRYLKNWQQDTKAILFLPGYQGEGTAGHALANGEKSVSSPDGEMVNWQGEVLTSDAFSSHAEQSELLTWIQNVGKDKTIYLIHGEEKSKISLQEKLKELGYLKVEIPSHGKEVNL